MTTPSNFLEDKPPISEKRKTKRIPVRGIQNLLAYEIVLLAAILLDVTMLLGTSTLSVYEKYSNLLTPIPVTYLIQVPMILLTQVFVVFQTGLLDGNNFSEILRICIGNDFIYLCLFRFFWVIFWHEENLNLALLSSLLVLLFLLRISWKTGQLTLQKGAKWMKAIFDLGIGWNMVQMFWNLAMIPMKEKFYANTFGLSTLFTIFFLLSGAVLGSFLILITKSILSVLPLYLAFLGTTISHLSPKYFDSCFPQIILTCFLGVLLLFGATALFCYHEQCQKMLAKYVASSTDTKASDSSST